MKETRQYKEVYNDPTGVVYLEVVEDALVLHTMLFDLSKTRHFLDVAYLLELELLERGYGVLLCFVNTPKEIRFAEVFGFEQTSIVNDLGDKVMIKDLHV